MRFGFAVPIFANPGVPYFRTPNFEKLDWPITLASVRRASDLDFDSIWVADHMFLGRDGAILEGWTTLAALAFVAPTARLGTIHLSTGFRHAPLTAKMVATLDVISDGRLEFFIDPGWREREFIAYGFEWLPDRATRVQQTEEAIRIYKALWSGEAVSHQGDFYTLDNAICQPVPVQQGGPRIWLGEALDDESLSLIAREADVWNSIPASPELLASKIASVDAACRAQGRDPATLVKTLETQVLVYENRREANELFGRFDGFRERYPAGDAMEDVFSFLREVDPSLDAYRGVQDFYDEFLIGTPDEVTTKLRTYCELGIEEVICWFMDLPSPRSMELFAKHVMPLLATPGGSVTS